MKRKFPCIMKWQMYETFGSQMYEYQYSIKN